jgi:hypothetical protein
VDKVGIDFRKWKLQLPMSDYSPTKPKTISSSKLVDGYQDYFIHPNNDGSVTFRTPVFPQYGSVHSSGTTRTELREQRSYWDMQKGNHILKSTHKIDQFVVDTGKLMSMQVQ